MSVSGRVLVNGRLISLEAAARRLRNHAPGKHSQKSHGGGGGSSDDDDGPDEGNFGYGVDPNGVSYDEADVDDAGNPKFSQSYRDKYGPLESDTGFSNGIALAEPKKGKAHIADDSDGTQNRRVVQEFTKRQAAEAGAAVYGVYSGMINEGTTSSGVHVKAASDDPRRDGVNVTWADGTKSFFDGEAGNDEAFALQEAFDLARGDVSNRA